MTKLVVWIGMSVGSGLGWWALSRLGIFPAFLGSIVGTALGLYCARRLARDLGA